MSSAARAAVKACDEKLNSEPSKSAPRPSVSVLPSLPIPWLLNASATFRASGTPYEGGASAALVPHWEGDEPITKFSVAPRRGRHCRATVRPCAERARHDLLDHAPRGPR
ncbi:hypothetical protein HDG37_002799 [Paraburkholderia sp. MM5384-R2]|nr:hypothetical protein [Paraburkholderia sp. MM5384-R2]